LFWKLNGKVAKPFVTLFYFLFLLSQIRWSALLLLSRKRGRTGQKQPHGRSNYKNSQIVHFSIPNIEPKNTYNILVVIGEKAEKY
jgi:hypothetical protein